MNPANHPATCRACHGTGYTLQPCTHHWSNDDPEPTELITLDQYLELHPDDTPIFRHRRIW